MNRLQPTKELPVVAQPTGQVTCSSLTDISKYPNNTNVDFTNVFDNQVDFARVDYIALENIMFTTAPPPPPTIASIQFAASLTADFATDAVLSVATPTSLFAHPEGQLSLSATLDATALSPAFASFIGQPLNTDALVAALIAFAGDIFTNPETPNTTPIAIADMGSFGTNLQLVTSPPGAPKSSIYASVLSSGQNLAKLAISNDIVTMAQYTPTGPNPLYIAPLAPTWDPITILEGQLGIGALDDLSNALCCVSTPGSYSTSVPTTTLQATMSDASIITLGEVTFSLALNYARRPTILSTSPLPGNIIRGLPMPSNRSIATNGWPAISYDALPNNTVGTLSSDWTARIYNDFNGTYADKSASVMTPTNSSPHIGNIVRPTFIWVPANTLFHTITSPRRRQIGPIRYSIPRPLKSAPYSASLYAPPVSTYDNILQIVCSELDVDRTAGSNSSQLLAVVPFDFTQLASGFYNIPIPVNSLVWRRMADIHVRSLSIGLFNGLGEPHAALAGNPITTTLQLRYI